MSENPNREALTDIPTQEELPLAIVQGQALASFPKDLYIPPDALEVILEAFEGPLDLLLYLIRRENLDILDIPIAEITRQYTAYIEIIHTMRLELAGEYLVMSAMLAEIKSRMLLPRPAGDEDDEEDPRAELVRRLQEYERFKQAAGDLDALPQLGRDVYQAVVERVDGKQLRLPPEVDLQDLISAFQEVMKRASMFAHHHVQMESLSVRERMSSVMNAVQTHRYTRFLDLFTPEEGRMGVVVTFLAVLELTRESLIELTQTEPFAPIHVRAASSVEQLREQATA
jgi:segregation and condensation protein A